MELNRQQVCFGWYCVCVCVCVCEWNQSPEQSALTGVCLCVCVCAHDGSHSTRSRGSTSSIWSVTSPLISSPSSSSSSSSSSSFFSLCATIHPNHSFLAPSRRRANSLLCFCSPTAWQPEHLWDNTELLAVFWGDFPLRKFDSCPAAPPCCRCTPAGWQFGTSGSQVRPIKQNPGDVFTVFHLSRGQQASPHFVISSTLSIVSVQNVKLFIKLQATGSTNPLKSTCSLWRWTTVGLSQRAISQRASRPRNVGHGGALRGHQPPAASFLVMRFHSVHNHSDFSYSH